jgi:hypothetical protein
MHFIFCDHRGWCAGHLSGSQVGARLRRLHLGGYGISIVTVHVVVQHLLLLLTAANRLFGGEDVTLGNDLNN